MSDKVATIDFHVTAACTQACEYCWGPPRRMAAVGTGTARAIIDRVRSFGVRRIVFTGGDPLLRHDIVTLIRHAHDTGLEVALSTTGDRLTRDVLDATRGCIALISLPLDGSDEARNARTKRPGHFAAVLSALALLRDYPEIDVKVCTPVTRDGVDDVVNIAALTQAWADTTDNRVFYNVFQVFPRSWEPCNWDGLTVSDAAWAAMVEQVETRRFRIRINFLSTKVLDQLYVLILPDGGLYVPSGPTYHYFGQVLDIDNIDAILSASTFDSIKHLAHSKAWRRTEAVAE
ncbi:MAG: radical SAM protein [Anaerolineae bacterium]